MLVSYVMQQRELPPSVSTTEHPSTPHLVTTPAEPLPAYTKITPYETTADDTYALLKQDNCGKAIDQTVKPDSKIPNSLEVKQTYDCAGTKLQLYLNRTEADGPYYVTFKAYIH
jgi:hypothetical protein